MVRVEMEWREEIGEARREWWESEQNGEGGNGMVRRDWRESEHNGEGGNGMARRDWRGEKRVMGVRTE